MSQEVAFYVMCAWGGVLAAATAGAILAYLNTLRSARALAKRQQAANALMADLAGVYARQWEAENPEPVKEKAA